MQMNDKREVASLVGGRLERQVASSDGGLRSKKRKPPRMVASAKPAGRAPEAERADAREVSQGAVWPCARFPRSLRHEPEAEGRSGEGPAAPSAPFRFRLVRPKVPHQKRGIVHAIKSRRLGWKIPQQQSRTAFSFRVLMSGRVVVQVTQLVWPLQVLGSRFARPAPLAWIFHLPRMKQQSPRRRKRLSDWRCCNRVAPLRSSSVEQDSNWAVAK